MKQSPDTPNLALPVALGLTLLSLFVAMTSPSFAQNSSVEKRPRIDPAYPIRFGDRTVEGTVRTDERYGHDGFFQGPRGWCYWNFLEDPQPIQNSNLWPDMRST